MKRQVLAIVGALTSSCPSPSVATMTSGAPTDPPSSNDEPDLLAEAFFREKNVADLIGEGDDSGPSIARRLVPLALGVFVLLVAVDVALRRTMPIDELAAWDDSEPAVYVAKVEHFKTSPAPDLLVLGSSRVRNGVVPEDVEGELVARGGPELDVFTLGLMNAKLPEWRALVRSHFPDPAPKRVVIGVTGSELMRVHSFQYAARFLWKPTDFVEYLERTSYANFKVENVESFVQSMLDDVWYLFQQRVPLREWLSTVVLDAVGLGETDPKKLERRSTMRAWQQAYVTDPDGYDPPFMASKRTLAQDLKRDAQAVRGKIPKRELGRQFHLRGDALTMLEELVADLRARGCEVAFVEVPASPFLQELNPVLHGDTFRERFAEVCKDLDVAWIPFGPERSFFSNTMYRDVSHFSVRGARTYSRAFARRLLASGFLDEDDAP